MAARRKRYPIKYWSHSSLISFLRNPLAWHKRYVEKIYDTPSSPAGVIGRSAHFALEQFYGGTGKEASIAAGLSYLRSVPDFELNFGVAKTKAAKKKKRESMEREYLQAIGFYLERPPRHKVVGIEVRGMATIPGLPLPVKAISDLVVESKIEPGSLDIVDHKFVDSFSSQKEIKALFMLQAIFNYYTVSQTYERPVRRFVVYECKKRKNADGRSQLRRYVLDFQNAREEFEVFHRLVADATEEIGRVRKYLPNPSDMFEGEDSFTLYRLRLLDDELTEPWQEQRQ